MTWPRSMYILLAGFAACATTHGHSIQGSLPSKSSTLSVSASALQIAGAPDGSLWYTSSNSVVHVTARGNLRSYEIPSARPVPAGIAVGSSGTWFTEFAAGKVGLLSRGTIKEWNLDDGFIPAQVAVDSKGNAWVTISEDHLADGRIAEFYANGGYQYFPVPSLKEIAGVGKPLAVDPEGIAACRNGVWFTEAGDARIGHITPAGRLTRIALPSRDAQPYRIACAPDGSVWFTETGIGKVAHMGPAEHIAEFAVPGRPRLQSVAVDHSGRTWFTDRAVDTIQWVDLRGRIHRFQMPSGASPINVSAAHTGLWISTLRAIVYINAQP